MYLLTKKFVQFKLFSQSQIFYVVLYDVKLQYKTGMSQNATTDTKWTWLETMFKLGLVKIPQLTQRGHV